MLKYIFINLILLLCVLSIHAQYDSQFKRSNSSSKSSSSYMGRNSNDDDDERPRKKKKKIPYPYKKRGVSFGVDLSRVALPILTDDRKALEFNIRTNFKKRMFLSGSFGYENVDFNKKEYSYKSNGAYFRFGFDYDFFVVEDPGNNDDITIGLRYAMGWQQQESPKLTIYDGYWGNYTSKINKYSINTHWVESVVGMRTELLKNLYLGAYLRLKIKLFSDNNEIMKPAYIPGFGNGDSNAQFGFTYVIAYKISWKNSKYKNNNIKK